MTQLAALTYAPDVRDGQATAALDRMAGAADRLGAAVTETDQKLNRSNASFDAIGRRYNEVERAAAAVERATRLHTRAIEDATRAAQAEGVSQERLQATIASITRAREQAAQRAVEGYQAETRAAALARTGYEQLAAAQQRAATSAASVSMGWVNPLTMAQREAAGLAAANDNAARSTGRLTQTLGMAGIQAGDFASQVGSGGNALIAFGQQAAQVGGFFGAGGAIAGAAIMFAAIAAKTYLASESAETLTEALKQQEDGYQRTIQAADRWREGLDTEAQQILRLAEYYTNLDATRRAYEVRALEATQRRLQTEAAGLADRATEPLDGLRNRIRLAEGLSGARGTELPAQLAEARELLRAYDELSKADPRQALLNLTQGLAAMATEAGRAGQGLRDAVTAVDASVVQADRLTRAMEMNQAALAAARGEALNTGSGVASFGAQADAAGGRARGLAADIRGAAAAMAALRARAVDDPLADVNAEITRQQQVLQALRTGGLAAGQRVAADQAAQADTTRIAAQIQERFVKALQDTGVSAEEASRRGQEAAPGFVAAAASQVRVTREREELERKLAEATRNRGGADQQAGEVGRIVTDIERDRQSLLNDGVRVTESVRTEAEKYADEVGRLNNLLAAGAISQETFNRALARANPETARAEQAAQRAQQRVEQQADQFIATYSRDLARGTTDALFDGFEKGKDFGQSMADAFRRSLRNAATAALDALVFRPVMQMGANALGFGSPAASLPSIFGGTPQAVGTAAGGTDLLGQAGMLSSASSMYRSVTGGVASSPWFNAAVPFSETGLMGATGIGSFLNTPLYGVTGGMQAAATNSALGAIPMGPATADAVVAAGGTAGQAGGLTIGSALGPAAGIAGGAYGIYSGIQKGGVGGLVGGLGGAASMVGGAGMLAGAMGVLPGLAALGPAGLIAGAVLAIAGSLLPGQKASSSAQGAGIAFEDGRTWYDGNTKHFSQENRDEAERFARSIASLETSIQGLTGYGIGGYVSVGVDSERRGDPANIFLRMGGNYAEFARDEAGAKAMAEKAAEWMWAEFRSQADRAPTADVGSIIRASGTAQDFEANLQWYEQTYKVLTQNTEATSAYATSLANLRKPYDEAISKADQLGLATDALVRKRDEELARATRARDLQLQQIDFDLANRAAGSAGLVAASQAALAAEREVEQLRETLRNLGLSAAETATRLDQLAQAQARQQQTLVTAMRAEGRLDVSSTFTGVIQPLQQLLQFWQQSGGLSDRGVSPQEAWPWMFNQLKAMLGGLSYDQLKSVEVAFPDVPGADDDAVRQVVAELKRQIIQQNDRALLEATGQGGINTIRDLIAQFEQLAPRLAEMGQNAAAWQTLDAQLTAIMRDMSAEQVAAIKAAFPQGTFQPHIPGTDRQEDDLIRRIAAAREAELAAAEASAKAAQELEQALQAGGSIRAFLDGLRSTGAGGLSPQEQLLNAQGAFGRDLTLARGGDADALARITGTAQNLLAAGQGMYASSPDFAALRAFVMSSLESLPATRTYDAQILKALQDLGGSVNVAVEVQSVRQISEVLNALSTEDKARLVQTATVVRTVEERLGRALTATEREGLIQAADVLRTVQQSMGADLTAAQRAGLVQGGAVIRSIEQGLSRSLTAGERAALIEGGAIGSYVFQFLQRDLTPAERAALVQPGSVLRMVEQSIGRNLTDAERDSLIQSGYALHAVFQMMGGNLSAAERDSLVQSALVVRSIEQSLARSLTDAERASLVDGGAIGSFVYQFLQRDLTAAERAALVQAGIVSRDVRQAIETTETVQISRSVDDKLSGILQAINRSMLSLIVVSQAGFASVARTVASGTYTSPGVALDQSGRLGEYQDDSGFVASLYRSLLRREPDPQGMSAILAFLGRGGSRGEVLDGFTFAPEFWRVGYASGGLVTGGIPGVDSVPANLMPGEYVLRAEAVRGLGAANLDVLNAGYIPAVPVANDGGSTEEVRELRRAVQGLREEVAALRAERARDAQQVKASLSRTADAAEDTAASNRVIARDSRGVVGDRRRAG